MGEAGASGGWASDGRRLFTDVVAALSLVQDLEEDRKLYHAWRVGILAGAAGAKFLPDDSPYIFFGALLHDIGAIGLSGQAVAHPSLGCDPAALPLVVEHPHRGAEIVAEIPGLGPAARLIADHHECWDGSGYPMGKVGRRIPVGAQVVHAADLLDVYTRDVPDCSQDEALRWLRKAAGSQVRRDVIDMLCEIVAERPFFEAFLHDDALPGLLHTTAARVPELSVAAPQEAAAVSVRVLGRVIDAKHQYTGGHSSRVARYSAAVASAMGLGPVEAERIRWIGYLHDAGKVTIPSHVLDKPGRLTAEEYALIRRHPLVTSDIVETMADLRDLACGAAHHHERYDGGGYPDGLTGESTPLVARIIAVGDAFDAITSLRPYQRARGLGEAVDILHCSSGTQFDPHVVDAAAATLPLAFPEGATSV